MEIGPFELLVIGFVVLLFFGPSKLPKVGRAIGETIKGFKQAMNPESPPVTPPKDEIPPRDPNGES